MKRNIIRIDREKCTGCGICVPDCPEGAIQMIDGKATLISDLFCDGLGACIKQCPVNAIAIEEREAEPYDERLVMGNVVKQGANVIKAHLKHLKDHAQDDFLSIAIDYLNEHNIPVPELEEKAHAGCPGRMAEQRAARATRPGSMARQFAPRAASDHSKDGSELQQWPVQLKLVNPASPFFKNADLLVAADCAPFAYNGFHSRFLKGKALVIMCPKLDPYQEEYVEKLAAIIKNNDLKSITAVRMEVPCCGGINYYIEKALEKAGKTMMVKEYVVSLQGEIV